MEFKKTVLENGLRVISAPIAGIQTATVLVLIGTGLEYETKKLNGISHFLEHMCFKGTERRSYKDIAKELDTLGAEFNAFTSNEVTGYYIKTDSTHLDVAFDVVSDILLHSKISSDELEKERGTIIEEINMYHDNPMIRVAILLDQVLYGDQPAGWEIAGTKETVSQMTRRDITNYMRERYLARNLVLVVAGKVAHRGVTERAKQYFGRLSSGERLTKLPTIEIQSRPQQLVFSKNTEQAHIVLGVRAYALKDQSRYPLRILNTILGGNMSSRLFVEVREKRGLAYYIKSIMDCSTDHGVLATRAGFNTAKTSEAMEVILKEYKKITKKSVSKEELERAKSYTRGKARLDTEASNAVAMFLGEQELLLEEINTIEQELGKIDKVSAEDVQKIAQEIFVPEKLNLAAIGPFKDKDKKRFQDMLDSF